MKKMLTMMSFILLSCSIARAESGIGDKVKETAHETAKSIKHAAHAIGDGIKRGAHQTAVAAKRAKNHVIVRCKNGDHAVRRTSACKEK